MYYVQDTETKLYLGYDGGSDCHIWVAGLEVAHGFENQNDTVVVLAVLNGLLSVSEKRDRYKSVTE